MQAATCCRSCRGHVQRVGPRLGLADSDKVEGRPGDTALNLTAKIASSPAEAAKVYPGNYWFSLLQPPAKSESPARARAATAFRPRWRRRRMDVQHQERLQLLPPARQTDHPLARAHGPFGIQDARGSMDLPHAARCARQLDGRHDGAVGLERRRARDGRLDDAHRERRAAARAAAAAARRRAQRRRDAVGLGRRLVVHARRDHDRQERSDGQRLRPRVRGVRRPRQAHGARSDRERRVRDHDPDARGRAPSAVAVPAACDAVEFLGHEASLGSREPGRSAQSR